MSTFSISPSLRCQYLDNTPGMTLVDPGNNDEYSMCPLSMIRSASCLWSLVFARKSCGCSLRAGFSDFWSYPIAVVLYPMDRRHSLSSSVSSTISIQMDTSYTKKYNRLICARPQYSLGICHLHDLTFDMKPPIHILQALVR